jgi:hypothetical protein
VTCNSLSYSTTVALLYRLCLNHVTRGQTLMLPHDINYASVHSLCVPFTTPISTPTYQLRRQPSTMHPISIMTLALASIVLAKKPDKPAPAPPREIPPVPIAIYYSAWCNDTPWTTWAAPNDCHALKNIKSIKVLKAPTDGEGKLFQNQ